MQSSSRPTYRARVKCAARRLRWSINFPQRPSVCSSSNLLREICIAIQKYIYIYIYTSLQPREDDKTRVDNIYVNEINAAARGSISRRLFRTRRFHGRSALAHRGISVYIDNRSPSRLSSPAPSSPSSRRARLSSASSPRVFVSREGVPGNAAISRP